MKHGTYIDKYKCIPYDTTENELWPTLKDWGGGFSFYNGSRLGLSH